MAGNAHTSARESFSDLSFRPIVKMNQTNVMKQHFSTFMKAILWVLIPILGTVSNSMAQDPDAIEPNTGLSYGTIEKARNLGLFPPRKAQPGTGSPTSAQLPKIGPGTQVGYISHHDGRADVYSEPSADSKFLREVTPSDWFLITESVGTWKRVAFFDGTQGFIFWKYVQIMTGDSIMKETDEFIGLLGDRSASSTAEFLLRMGELSSRIKPGNKETKALVLIKLRDAEAPILEGEGYKIYQNLADAETVAIYNEFIEKRKAAAATYEPGPVAEYFLQFGRNIRDGFVNSMSSSDSSPVAPTTEASPQKVPCSACSGRGGHSPGYKGALEFGANFQKCPVCDGTGRVWAR